jgi:hypothetical protein
VEQEGLKIPTPDALNLAVDRYRHQDPGRADAALDFLHTVEKSGLSPGWLSVPHPYKRYGLQAAAYRLGVPFTAHPMIGHDIIYVHPMNNCAAIGRVAERDFLTFAHGVTGLSGGVYLSVGSAVMSPMVFEKSLSMAQNLALQEGWRIEDHLIVVVDLVPSSCYWSQGEPPWDSSDFYVRFNKTFSRMGGSMRYLQMDNKAFFPALLRALE